MGTANYLQKWNGSDSSLSESISEPSPVLFRRHYKRLNIIIRHKGDFNHFTCSKKESCKIQYVQKLHILQEFDESRAKLDKDSARAYRNSRRFFFK